MDKKIKKLTSEITNIFDTRKNECSNHDAQKSGLALIKYNEFLDYIKNEIIDEVNKILMPPTEVTLEKFCEEMRNIRNNKNINFVLEYFAREGEEDWNYCAFTIGYSDVDENNIVEFNDDSMELPRKYDDRRVLCYSYQRNSSEEEGVFAIDCIEDWSDEKIYKEFTKYGKLFEP